MKRSALLSIFSIVFFAFSCDSNDDTSNSPVLDGFTHNNVFYETPNAYIEIDEDDNNTFPDNYTIFFTDGRMYDNDLNVNGSSGDYLFSLNTTKLVFLQIEASDNPSLNGLGLQPNTSYVVSNQDSVIIYNAQIDALNPSFFINNVEFGVGNENAGVINTPNNASSTITFTEINIDTNNLLNSTIEADYIFVNQVGESITGTYKGTFGLILD